MNVQGMKEGGVKLADIGMAIAFEAEVPIPHNLARRSKDLQAALDAGEVKVVPAKIGLATRPTKGTATPHRTPMTFSRKAAPNLTQQVAELIQQVAELTRRVGRLEGENEALTAKVEALHKPPKKTSSKKTSKKTSSKKTSKE